MYILCSICLSYPTIMIKLNTTRLHDLFRILVLEQVPIDLLGMLTQPVHLFLKRRETPLGLLLRMLDIRLEPAKIEPNLRYPPLNVVTKNPALRRLEH